MCLDLPFLSKIKINTSKLLAQTDPSWFWKRLVKRSGWCSYLCISWDISPRSSSLRAAVVVGGCLEKKQTVAQAASPFFHLIKVVTRTRNYFSTCRPRDCPKMSNSKFETPSLFSLIADYCPFLTVFQRTWILVKNDPLCVRKTSKDSTLHYKLVGIASRSL